eukprot:403338556
MSLAVQNQVQQNTIQHHHQKEQNIRSPQSQHQNQSQIQKLQQQIPTFRDDMLNNLHYYNPANQFPLQNQILNQSQTFLPPPQQSPIHYNNGSNNSSNQNYLVTPLSLDNSLHSSQNVKTHAKQERVQSLNSSQQISNLQDSQVVQSLFYDKLTSHLVKPEKKPKKDSQVKYLQEMDTLKTQVASLKEIIAQMENSQIQSHKENFPELVNQQAKINPNYMKNLEVLIQRWRNKVYELLVDKKRYEIIIKENNRGFTLDRQQLIKDRDASKQQMNLTQQKLEQSLLQQKAQQEQIEDLKSSLQQSKNQNGFYALQNQKLREFIHDIEMKQIGLDGQTQIQLQMIDKQNKRLETLQALVKYHSDERSNHSISKSFLQSINKDLTQKVQELYSELESSKIVANELEAQKKVNVDQSNTILEFQRKIESLEISGLRELKELQSKFQDLQQNFSLQNEYAKSLEEEKRNLRIQVDDFLHQLRETKADCVQTLMTKEKNMRDRINELENDNKKMKQQIIKLERQIKEDGEELESEVTELNNKLKKQLQEKDKALKQLKTERDTLFQELNSLSNQSGYKQVRQSKNNDGNVFSPSSTYDKEQSFPKAESSSFNRYQQQKTMQTAEKKNILAGNWLQSPIKQQPMLSNASSQKNLNNEAIQNKNASIYNPFIQNQSITSTTQRMHGDIMKLKNDSSMQQPKVLGQNDQITKNLFSAPLVSQQNQTYQRNQPSLLGMSSQNLSLKNLASLNNTDTKSSYIQLNNSQVNPVGAMRGLNLNQINENYVQAPRHTDMGLGGDVVLLDQEQIRKLDDIERMALEALEDDEDFQL